MEAFRGAKGKKRPSSHKWLWTQEEDVLLTTLVNANGGGNWDFIATHIQGRTGKSCRLRWLNQLDPTIVRTPFTGEENQRLIELHREYGNKWSTIGRFFQGRTDNHLKNQYHVLMGSRHMKACGPSASTDACGPIKTQSNGNVSTVPVGDSSSVYGRDDSDQGTSDEDSIMSDATSEHCSVAQPQQAVGIMDYQFFDFMGVGSSD